MIHLRVVSPPDVTGVLMPMLHSEPAVVNLTMLPGAVEPPGRGRGAEGTFPPSWFALLRPGRAP